METSDRTILRRLILTVTLILLIGAVIWVFFVRDSGKKEANQKSGNTNSGQQAGGATNQSDKQSAGNGAETGASRSQQGNNTAPTASGQQPTHLANAGPGNLAALFVGSVVMGGICHALYQKRRHHLAV